MRAKKEKFSTFNEVSYYNSLELIGAILRLAAQDMKYGDKQEVIEFMDSEWFEEICFYLDSDTETIKYLISRGKVNQRMEYH